MVAVAAGAAVLSLSVYSVAETYFKKWNNIRTPDTEPGIELTNDFMYYSPAGAKQKLLFKTSKSIIAQRNEVTWLKLLVASLICYDLNTFSMSFVGRFF